VDTSDLARLRHHAIVHSLFAPTTLGAAIDRLGFVQADPIRAPARAQDLILRQRVAGYRAGDLEREYPSLDVEEGYVFLYGFVPRGTWELLHPRARRATVALERSVLKHLQGRGPVHPRDLEEAFGRKRVVNAWGGSSKATTRALDRLHDLGHLRIVRRDNGVRVYEAAQPATAVLTKSERLRKLVLEFANLLAPVSEKTLQSILVLIRREIAPAENTISVRAMLSSGELEAVSVDGKTYVWPAEARDAEPAEHDAGALRILAPFDPVVWDRERFERFWGWSYRFEAYTPPAKRVRGYYAMPLLWREQMIGWANIGVTGGALDVNLGFVDARPKTRVFQNALDKEIESFRAFLGLAARA
jgi:uncharacterized protein